MRLTRGTGPCTDGGRSDKRKGDEESLHLRQTGQGGERLAIEKKTSAPVEQEHQPDITTQPGKPNCASETNAQDANKERQSDEATVHESGKKGRCGGDCD